MRIPFALRHALREWRSGIGRIGWFTVSIALGIAALVTLYGFQRDIESSTRREARTLLGGDLRFQSSEPLSERVEALLDSLAGAGSEVSRGVALATVVYAPESGRARLFQVHGVDRAFPLSGGGRGDPPEVVELLRQGGGVATDPLVLLQLDADRGDPIRIGSLELDLLGAVEGFPVDLELQWAAGPPIFMALDDLEGSGLLGFGSLVQYRAWVVLPEGSDPEGFQDRYRGELRGEGASVRTALGEAEDLASGFEELLRFLSLAGGVALLLGGVGVGSAADAYIRERIPSVALLRCLGARRGTLFRSYLFQTAAMGGGGAAVGALLGSVLHLSLPGLLTGILPPGVSTTFHPDLVLGGILLGSWVAVVFSLFPLLRVQKVPPLAALRVEPERDRKIGAGEGAIAVGLPIISLLLLASLHFDDLLGGVILTVALLLVLILLLLTARGLSFLAARRLPDRTPFPIRQGISGLFRPGSQTDAVILALGIGAFLVGSLLVVEGGLRARLASTLSEESASLLLFDIQPDQREGVAALLESEGLGAELLAIVPSRIREVRRVGVAADSTEERGGGGWAFRRLYRNSSREALGPSERVVEGSWWDEEDPATPEIGSALAEGAVQVSLEVEVAGELGVGIGDRILWDIQGVPLLSVVTSLREVEWATFQPNFFAIFEPGALDGAPGSYIAMVEAEDQGGRERIQLALLDNFPTISFLDLSTLQATLNRMVGEISLILRTMAGFVLLAGGVVFLAALLSTRFRRRRESALLKTLGAGGKTIKTTLLVEYALLGTVGGGIGLLLGGVGGELLLRGLFDVTGGGSWWDLAGVWAGIILVATLLGWSVSGPVLRAPAMTVLRGG